MPALRWLLHPKRATIQRSQKVTAYSETARRRRSDDSRPDQNSFVFGIRRTFMRCLPLSRNPQRLGANGGLGTRAGRIIGDCPANTDRRRSVRKLGYCAPCERHDSSSRITGNAPSPERFQPSAQAFRSARSNNEFSRTRKVLSPCAGTGVRARRPGTWTARH
jgi:hypothetical protein